jgi:hypothetical protein
MRKPRRLRAVPEPIVHPITGLPFDFEHVCKTCVHFTDKTRTLRGNKYRTITCALDPEKRNLADTPGTAWPALPACTRHQRLVD